MRKLFQKVRQNYRSFFFLAVIFLAVGLFLPMHGVSADGGLVPCGKTGQEMCTLCDLIGGINGIIQYLLRIAIGLALTIFTAAGVMYIISTGNSGMIDLAKAAMKNSLIGFAVILTAWIMINTLLLTVGANSNLGITGVTAWGKFECSGTH